MKIKDLIEILKKYDNKINLGDLSIEINGADIDLKSDGILIGWLNANDLESECDTVAHSTDTYKKFLEETASLEARVNELTGLNAEKEKMIKYLKETVKQSELNDGKIVAYEKILFGEKKLTME